MTILYINQMCWTHEPNGVKENTKLKTCKLICNYTIICLPKHVLNLHHARKLTQLSWRHLWIVITVQGEQLIDAYSDIISTLYYWTKIKLVRWLMRKWWRIQNSSSYSYICFNPIWSLNSYRIFESTRRNRKMNVVKIWY